MVKSAQQGPSLAVEDWQPRGAARAGTQSFAITTPSLYNRGTN